MSDARHAPEADLLAVLRDALDGAPVAVEPAGPEGEIAVVSVGPDRLARLLDPGVRRRVAEAARRAGYRHAAADVDPAVGALDGAESP